MLIFVDWYEPGFKGGGPIRSCVNLVEHVRIDCKLYIVTRDRDLGMNRPYENLVINEWIEKSGVSIFYGSPKSLNWKGILFRIQEIRPDVIYINGMFSKIFSVYPLLIRKWYDLSAHFIVTPRGMLKATALQFKSRKKYLFLLGMKWLGLYKGVTFQATDKTEFEDIKHLIGKLVEVELIPNLPGRNKTQVSPILKVPGELKVIFVGRSHRIKNLHRLLEWLPLLDGRIFLTIVTTEEDAEYWNECQRLINQFSEMIEVTVMKDVPHEQIEGLISAHHIFILPTEGENFGHAIFESFLAGRPVIISNQTPWRNLKENTAGWDIGLLDNNGFLCALREALSWGQIEMDQWSYGAWSLGVAHSNNEKLKQQYLEFFNSRYR